MCGKIEIEIGENLRRVIDNMISAYSVNVKRDFGTDPHTAIAKAFKLDLTKIAIAKIKEGK